MKNKYGECKRYGRKNIIERLLLSIIKLSKGKSGWVFCRGKCNLKGLDKSEEEL